MIRIRYKIHILIFSLVFLTGCSKIKEPETVQQIDSLITISNQPIEKPVVIDTSRGVFLIFKLGANSTTVGNVKEYLVKKGTLKLEIDSTSNPSKKLMPDIRYYYSLPVKLINNKSSKNSDGIHFVSGNGDSYEEPQKEVDNNLIDARANVLFHYSSENKLYRLELYFACGYNEFHNTFDISLPPDSQKGSGLDQSHFLRVREDAKILQKSIYKLYSSKYNSWTTKKNNQTCYDYFHKEKNLEISISHTGLGVSVNYQNKAVLSETKKTQPTKKNISERNIKNDI